MPALQCSSVRRLLRHDVTSSLKYGGPSHRPGDIAVAQIAAAAAIGKVVGSHCGKTVMVDPFRMLSLKPVEPGGIATEHGCFEGAVGRTQRLEAVLLLHVLGDFQPAQALDLPLRRAVHTASVPQTMWSGPSPLTSIPISAAARRGCDTAVQAKICPRSPYTLVTPYFSGISARLLVHDERPVLSNSAIASAGLAPTQR